VCGGGGYERCVCCVLVLVLGVWERGAQSATSNRQRLHGLERGARFPTKHTLRHRHMHDMHTHTAYFLLRSAMEPYRRHTFPITKETRIPFPFLPSLSLFFTSSPRTYRATCASPPSPASSTAAVLVLGSDQARAVSLTPAAFSAALSMDRPGEAQMPRASRRRWRRISNRSTGFRRGDGLG